MNVKKILRAVGLKPNALVSALTNEVAMQDIVDFIENLNLKIRVKKICKEEWWTLFAGYDEAIFLHHPENYHQLRALFLWNESMLKKYGLTDEDVARLDFC